MTVAPPDETAPLTAAAAAEIARVRESGILGTSGRLLELFEFLARRSAEGRPPKETEIAHAVFGKTGPDSLRDDPVARVYIHRLRKRLDDFYLRHGTRDGIRIDIPKGDYRIACIGPERIEAGAEDAATSSAVAPGEAQRVARRKMNWGLAAAAFAVVALAANIAAWAVFANRPAPPAAQLADSGMWTGIAKSNRPLLIVVGDYYMFGEYEDRTKLKRLIRDFAINSKEDLASSQWTNPKDFEKYSDVALQYLPASAAFALADLAPLIQDGRKVQVTLSSNLPLERLKTDDIIYVGLLSGLGALRDPVFSNSRFAVGKSYDQIIDLKTRRTYNSEAFLAAPRDEMYRDYGFFSSFQGPSGNRIMILSGSRDTAVMGVAEAVTQIERLQRVETKTPKKGDFEALFEVKGQKHMNLEASVLAAYPIDGQAIWSGDRANTASYPAK